MAKGQLKVGDLSNVSGEVNIATGDIIKGYTVEQVANLLVQIQTTFQPKPFDGRCPYKGLDAFEEEDAELFFGREKLVEDLVARVKQSRTVFVTGPSGSGKSSLVRAGLIPALKHGAISNLHSERWLFESMKPGRDPLVELGRVASSLAGNLSAGDDIRTKGLKDATILAQWCEIALKEGRDKRAVLFIDQFEEIFTQVSKDSERRAFLSLLTHASAVENGRMIVLFSMRSDFVSNCASYPKLNALLNQQFVQIGAMQPDELVSAIAQPALRVGLRIDPDLVAQIINDMKGEPGTLPLMQFALKDLFDAQQAKSGVIALTLNDYLQRGGMHKSLERHADDAFANLNDVEKELARSIFSGLIEIGRGTQDTRRTALFDELVPAEAKAVEVEAVVQKLADARLITTDEQAGKETATLAHEKLIDAWPWLKKLVNENRDAIALQNEITSDAKDWDDHKRNSSYLYSGARLANAREQLGAKKIRLSGTADEFVRAGLARQRRNLVALVGGVATIIALLILAVIIFSRQSNTNAQLAKQNAANASTAQAASTHALNNALTAQAASTLAFENAGTAQANAEEAQKQATIAGASQLAGQSVNMRDKDFLLSLLLGVEAFKTQETVNTHRALMDNTQGNPQLNKYLSGHTNAVNSIAFSSDGKTLASGGDDNTIILWDVATGQPIGQPLRGHTGPVYSVAFSPDGKTLASGSGDKTIILWNVATGQPLGQPLTGHTERVSSVAFSPDGKTLASGSYDNTIILWDVATGQPLDRPLRGHGYYVLSVAFSPDGKTLASGSADGTILLWDVTTEQPFGGSLKREIDYDVRSVVFSPDGKTLASGSQDSAILLWDMTTRPRQLIGQPLTEHTGQVNSVAFSPDGKTLASASEDNTIILWDVATGKPLRQPLTGHAGRVNSVAFRPDGKTLASGSADGTIILWDVSTLPNTGVTTAQPLGQTLRGHTGWVNSVAFSPDGKTLASGSFDGAIRLWDATTGQFLGGSMIGPADYVNSVAFSPDGKMLASGNGYVSYNPIGGIVLLWDIATHQVLGGPLRGHKDDVTSVAFSPDGKTVASGSSDNTIILWDVETYQAIGHPLRGHTSGVVSVAFSTDGKTLASGGWDGTVILWDVATEQPLGQPLTGNYVAFSPDGKTLASAGGDTIILWDVATHQATGQPLTGHSVASMVFSPDGKILASGSGDNTIILWDVATRQAIGQPLTGHSVASMAFSPDGKTLASGSWDKTIILWDVDPLSWINKTCQRAGRNLTRSEWAQYITWKPYPTKQEDATCPKWPLGSESSLTPTP